MTAPSERVARAATVLRERAQAATPGPWHAHDTWIDVGGYSGAVLRDPPTPSERPLLAWVPSFSSDPGGYRQQVIDARWIATVDPAVGLLLADLLDTCAEWAALLERQYGDRMAAAEIEVRPHLRSTLALADAILGGAE